MNKSSKPKLTARSNYHQGLFVPVNPFKYLGNLSDIKYRSKWERDFMQYCDLNPRISRWGSEIAVIPYISPVDNMQHRYFVDFFMETKLQSGKTKRFLIEIKPYAQCKQPDMQKIKKNISPDAKLKFQNEWRTYMVNCAKWDAARNYCKIKGWDFVILTERELYRK